MVKNFPILLLEHANIQKAKATDQMGSRHSHPRRRKTNRFPLKSVPSVSHSSLKRRKKYNCWLTDARWLGCCLVATSHRRDFRKFVPLAVALELLYLAEKLFCKAIAKNSRVLSVQCSGGLN